MIPTLMVACPPLARGSFSVILILRGSSLCTDSPLRISRFKIHLNCCFSTPHMNETYSLTKRVLTFPELWCQVVRHVKLCNLDVIVL